MRVAESVGAALYQNRGRIAILMLVLVWGYFLIAFGEQAWRARQIQAEVDAERASIAALARENGQLQAQADRYASDAYLDYVQVIARRDLNLANPGETMLLVRWDEPAGASEASPQDAAPPPDDRPNWQRWLDAFSGS